MAAGHGGPIRLTDEGEAHLGFILMAGKGYPLDAPAFQGDCVFMPLPRDAALFQGEPYRVLAEHKDAGEHRYALTFDGVTHSFTITSTTLNRAVYVTLGPDGSGEWGTRLGQEHRRLGLCHRVASRASTCSSRGSDGAAQQGDAADEAPLLTE